MTGERPFIGKVMDRGFFTWTAWSAASSRSWPREAQGDCREGVSL